MKRVPPWVNESKISSSPERAKETLSPFQGLEIFWTVDPGRRSQTRFALGYHLSGFQPCEENCGDDAANHQMKLTIPEPSFVVLIGVSGLQVSVSAKRRGLRPPC